MHVSCPTLWPMSASITHLTRNPCSRLAQGRRDARVPLLQLGKRPTNAIPGAAGVGTQPPDGSGGVNAPLIAQRVS